MLLLCERLNCIYLRRRVLVAFNTIQRILGGINCELRRVVTTAKEPKKSVFTKGKPRYLELDIGSKYSQEALSHVHNWLNRGSGGGFIDNGPRELALAILLLRIAPNYATYQTS